MKTVVIGIAGGTGAGKTTLANSLMEAFIGRAVLLSHDAYYKDLSNVPEEGRANVNFDAPEALESSLLARHLDDLRGGASVAVPVYDFSSHSRTSETLTVDPSQVVIAEGILLLSDPELRDRIDLKVFVDADADQRILRRIQRDVDERGRTVASVMEQYLATVKPMHELHVAPSRTHADLVVNGTGDITRAVEVIVAHVNAH